MSSESTPPLRLATTTTYQAGVIQSAMARAVKKFTDESLKVHGLTTMQWYIIGSIYDAGDAGISITELSKLLDTNLSYLTNVINLLESKSIVSRISGNADSRIKKVHITKAYQVLCPKIEADLRTKMREGIYAHIEPHELETYIAVINKLSKLDHAHHFADER